MKIISFGEFFKEFREEKILKESVIHKIKQLFILKDANAILDEFKKIFDIEDDIKLKRVEIGGKFNVETKTISYSTNNSLIHELVHYIQNRNETKIDRYVFPEFSDEGLLRYILQPLELNNWALSLADEALAFKSFEEFLRIQKKTNNFETANKQERLKHILYLLQSDVKYSRNTNNFKTKILKLTKRYYVIIKTLQQDTDKFLVEAEFVDFI